MNRYRTLSWMAIREMWISFRLIDVLGLPLLGGLLAIVAPPDLAALTAVGGAGFWYAVGASVAIAVAAGLAARTMADERRRGTVAWMVVRAVPRSAVFLSWFIAFGLLLGIGIVLGSIGAWLAALSHAEATPDAIPYGAAVGATIGAGLVAVALGLLLGALLPARPAALVAMVTGAVALAVSIAMAPGALPSPLGGIGLLAHLDGARRPLGDAMGSGGVALATTSILLILGVASLERSDL
jgi:hypothetical protein